MHGSLYAFVQALLVLNGLWALGAFVSWMQDTATPSAMKRRHFEARGIPFFCHFGMLNDVLTIHPLLALHVALMHELWRANESLEWKLGIAAGICAVGLNLWWAGQSFRAKVFEAQSCDGRLTSVGYIHIVHTAVILAIMFHMAADLFMGRMHPMLAAASISFILAHVMIGTHWPVKIMDRPWNPFPPGGTTERRLMVATFALQTLGMSGLCAYAAQTLFS